MTDLQRLHEAAVLAPQLLTPEVEKALDYFEAFGYEQTSAEASILRAHITAQVAALEAAEERARVLKAMCEWLARALAMKSWMSLTGITRQALGGDDEETRDAFVESETQSQLATAREAAKEGER